MSSHLTSDSRDFEVKSIPTPPSGESVMAQLKEAWLKGKHPEWIWEVGLPDGTNLNWFRYWRLYDHFVEQNRWHEQKEQTLASLSELGESFLKDLQEVLTPDNVQVLTHYWLNPDYQIIKELKEKGILEFATWLWDQAGKVSYEEALERARQFLNPRFNLMEPEAVLTQASAYAIHEIHKKPLLMARLWQVLWAHGYVLTQQGPASKSESSKAVQKDNSDKRKKGPFKLMKLRSPESLSLVLSFISDVSNGLLKWECLVAGEYFWKEIIQSFGWGPESSAKSWYLDFVQQKVIERLIPYFGQQALKRLRQVASDQALRVYEQNLVGYFLFPGLGTQLLVGAYPVDENILALVLVDDQGRYLSHTFLDRTQEGAVHKGQQLLKPLIQQSTVAAVVLPLTFNVWNWEPFLIEILGGSESIIKVPAKGLKAQAMALGETHSLTNLELPVLMAWAVAARAQDPLRELSRLNSKDLAPESFLAILKVPDLDEVFRRWLSRACYHVGLRLSAGYKSVWLKLFPESEWVQQVFQFLDSGQLTEKSDLMKIKSIDPSIINHWFSAIFFPQSRNPLDATRLPFERYPVARDLAQDLGIGIKNLVPLQKDIPAEILQKYESLLGPEAFQLFYRQLKTLIQDKRLLSVTEFKQKMPARLENYLELKAGTIVKGLVVQDLGSGYQVDIGLPYLAFLPMRYVPRISRAEFRLGFVSDFVISKVEIQSNQIQKIILKSSELKITRSYKGRKRKPAKSPEKQVLTSGVTGSKELLRKKKKTQENQRGETSKPPVTPQGPLKLSLKDLALKSQALAKLGPKPKATSRPHPEARLNQSKVKPGGDMASSFSEKPQRPSVSQQPSKPKESSHHPRQPKEATSAMPTSVSGPFNNPFLAALKNYQSGGQ